MGSPQGTATSTDHAAGNRAGEAKRRSCGACDYPDGREPDSDSTAAGAYTREKWEEDFKKKLKSPAITLQNYGGDRLNVVGQTQVAISRGAIPRWQ